MPKIAHRACLKVDDELLPAEVSTSEFTHDWLGDITLSKKNYKKYPGRGSILTNQEPVVYCRQDHAIV